MQLELARNFTILLVPAIVAWFCPSLHLLFTVNRDLAKGLSLAGLVDKALDFNPMGPSSKPLGGSQVKSAFHSSGVHQMSIWQLNGKMPPHWLSSLETVEPHP